MHCMELAADCSIIDLHMYVCRYVCIIARRLLRGPGNEKTLPSMHTVQYSTMCCIELLNTLIIVVGLYVFQVSISID